MSAIYLDDGDFENRIHESEGGDEEFFDLISALVDEYGAIEPDYAAAIYRVIGSTVPEDRGE